MGEPWRLGGIQIEADAGAQAATVRLLRLEHVGGGRVEVTGRIAVGKDMRSWRCPG
jgi:hypothetical protein